MNNDDRQRAARAFVLSHHLGRAAKPPKVAALYVDVKKGPYTKLAGVVPVGLPDDADRYRSSAPVVAHPPCGPWGQLYRRYKGGEGSAESGLKAVDIVRRTGGVLEHPRGSKLWRAKGMPRPGEKPDVWGGYTIQVRQSDWGHKAEKMTWLYIVGVPRENLPPFPAPREPTHVIDSSKKAEARGRHLPKSQRHLTPPEFATWLVEVARRVRRPAGP